MKRKQKHLMLKRMKKLHLIHLVAVNLDKQLKHYGGIQQIRWVSSQNRALKALLDNFQVTVIQFEEITHRKDDVAGRAKAYISIVKTDKVSCISTLHDRFYCHCICNFSTPVPVERHSYHRLLGG